MSSEYTRKRFEYDDLAIAKDIVIKAKLGIEQAIFQIEKLLQKEIKREEISPFKISPLEYYVTYPIEIGLTKEIRTDLMAIVTEQKLHLKHIDALLNLISTTQRARKK